MNAPHTFHFTAFAEPTDDLDFPLYEAVIDGVVVRASHPDLLRPAEVVPFREWKHAA